ncbi:hypothetical protein WDW86_02685 [Bdellovibrionota bacterium FG-2]
MKIRLNATPLFLGIICGLIFGLTSGCRPSEVLPPGCAPEGITLTSAGASNEASSDDTPFVLNPDSLRDEVLIKNTGLMLAANNVHRAKDSVSIARGNLLPSLNLGALLYSTTQRSFVLSSVEAVLPFLVPSKWFDYYKSKHLLSAEIGSLDIMRANTFASALALYFTSLGDLGLRELLFEEATDLAEIEDFTELAFQAGVGSEEDYLRVKAQRAMAQVSASKLDELLGAEKAMIRHALRLGSEREIQIEAYSMSPSEWEFKPVQELADQALLRSLERGQLEDLEKAAKLDRWSKIFGFVSAAGLRTAPGTGGAASFSNVYASESFSIGFANVPTVHLSQRNIDEIRIRETEIPAELLEVSETNLGSLVQGAQREALAREAWDALYHVVETKRLQFLSGVGGIVPFLQARSQLRQAGIEVLRAQILLTQDRIVLHRILRTDLFEKIPSCMPSKAAATAHPA